MLDGETTVSPPRPCVRSLDVGLLISIFTEALGGARTDDFLGANVE